MATKRQRAVINMMRAAESQGRILSVRELAEEMGVSESAAHGMMRRLIRAKLLKSDAPKGERRSRSVRLADSPKAPPLPASVVQFGDIDLFKDGDPADQPGAKFSIMPGYFFRKSVIGLFGLQCLLQKDNDDWGIRSGDVIVMSEAYPNTKVDSLCAAIVNGKWRVAIYRTSRARIWVTPISTGKRTASLDPAMGEAEVRGVAIGLIGRRDWSWGRKKGEPAESTTGLDSLG